jgi:beta-1,3-galactosyltransferase 1
VWPSNQSRDANVLVRPNEVTARLWPSSTCHRPSSAASSASSLSSTTTTAIIVDVDHPKGAKESDIYLLVIVCSAMQNFAERQTIRDSWGSEKIQHVKVIFLIGHVGNDTSPLQVNVTREADEFGDILQEDFIDNYSNLTIKSLMLLKWYTMSCSHVPYVLKTDDDVYINLANLYKLVTTNKKPNLLTGTLICGASPIRDPYNKWYAPNYMYDKKRYPNYLSGTAYLMSKSTASTLYEAALETSVFHLEDIFVTGILSQVAGIRPQDHYGFSYVKRRSTPCLYAQTISSHHLSMTEMRDMFNKVKDKGDKCAPIKKKYLRSYGPGRCFWAPPK